MLSGLRAWNEPFIRSLFAEEVAMRVLGTPLIPLAENRLLWNPGTRGTYSVKTTYQLCHSVSSPYARTEGDCSWSSIWRLDVPPNVKHFVWCLCTNCLPSRVRLREKGVDCTEDCMVCGSANETMWHALVSCRQSQHCWQAQGLWRGISESVHDGISLKELFFKMGATLSSPQLTQFAMTLWRLWVSRNNCLWNNVKDNSDRFAPVLKLLGKTGKQQTTFAWANLTVLTKTLRLGFLHHMGTSRSMWMQLFLMRLESQAWVCVCGIAQETFWGPELDSILFGWK